MDLRMTPQASHLELLLPNDVKDELEWQVKSFQSASCKGRSRFAMRAITLSRRSLSTILLQKPDLPLAPGWEM